MASSDNFLQCHKPQKRIYLYLLENTLYGVSSMTILIGSIRQVDSKETEIGFQVAWFD